jgi:gamma-glutamyltranspeptidase/glutathione hydrolase
MYPGDVSVESRIPEDTRNALIARGHKLRVSGAYTIGANAAVVVDVKTGVLHAGADPRSPAYAIAW